MVLQSFAQKSHIFMRNDAYTIMHNSLFLHAISTLDHLKSNNTIYNP